VLNLITLPPPAKKKKKEKRNAPQVTKQIKCHEDSNLCKLQEKLSIFFLLNIIVIEVIQYRSSNCLMQKLCQTTTNT
jgi:hypothetical protein